MSRADRALFTINGEGTLLVRSDKSLDYEKQDSYELNVRRIGTDASGNVRETVPVRITVNNVIEADSTEIVQLRDAGPGARIGKVNFGDDGETVTVHEGDDPSDNFAIVGDGLFVENNAVLEAGTYTLTMKVGTGETAQSHTVDIRVNDIVPDVDFTGTVHRGAVFVSSDASPILDKQGERLHFIEQSGRVETTYGYYTISSAKLTYTVDPAKFNLDTVRTDDATDTFFVGLRDEFGGRTRQEVAVTVQSVIGVGGNSITAWEDQPTAGPSGKIDITDPLRNKNDYTLSRINDTAITADTPPIDLDYGTLTVDQNWAWSYALDGDNATVEALDGDDDDTDNVVGRLTETVRITMTRANDESTPDVDESETLTRTFDITIIGRTDITMSAPGPFVIFQSLSQRESSDHLTMNGSDGLRSGGLTGGFGNDLLNAGDGDFRLSGGPGNDVLTGNRGSDSLYGGAGDDVLIGGAGYDRLEGGDDNDVLNGRCQSSLFHT